MKFTLPTLLVNPPSPPFACGEGVGDVANVGGVALRTTMGMVTWVLSGEPEACPEPAEGLPSSACTSDLLWVQ
jgi:hypothetical protein